MLNLDAIALSLGIILPETPTEPIPTGWGGTIRKVAVVAGVVAGARWYLRKRQEWRASDVEARSMVIEKFGRRLPDLRPSLRITSIAPIPPSQFHTHGTAAAFRTAANAAMAESVRGNGREPYHLSMSRADQTRGERGKRHFYWDKDLKVKFQNDEVGENDVVVLTDVDYYLEPRNVFQFGVPVMMYTLVPTAVEKRAVDYYYKIGPGDVVDYHVSGGGKYQHQLWNYDGDTISVFHDPEQWRLIRKAWCWLLDQFEVLMWKPHPLLDPRKIVVFDVEQMTIDGDPDHRIITFVPSFEVPYGHYWDRPTEFRRRKYVDKGIASLENVVAGTTSIALATQPGEVTLGTETLSCLSMRLGAKNTPFLIGDIEVFLHDKITVDLKEKASLLFAVLRTSLDLKYHRMVVSTSQIVTNYRPVDERPLEDERPVGQAITTPLNATSAVFPAKCADTGAVAVRERVTKLAHKTVPPQHFAKYAGEFVIKLVPKEFIRTGTPVTLDEVIADQDTPIRKARVEQASVRAGAFAQNTLKTFVKTESYGSVNDPRVITTCSTESLLEFSQFVKGFKQQVLSKAKWYGPGLTPEQTVDRLGEICRGGAPEEELVLRDFSRMDGRNSEWVRKNVTDAAYRRWIRDSELARFNHCVKQVYKQRATMQTGPGPDNSQSYNAGQGTRSGSAGTTDYNTIPNAFVSYCTFREMGLEPEKAWKSLSLYYGDDSVDRALPGFAEVCTNVCVRLGMEAECEVKSKGEPISYLARIFPDPARFRTSYADLQRTIPKLHLSSVTTKTVDRLELALNKARGYFVTDEHTPIIGDWARVVIALCEGKVSKKARKTAYEGSVKWRESHAWPQPVEENHLLVEGACRDLGMDSDELEARRVAICSSKNLDDIPVVTNIELPVKCTALLGDTLVKPAPKSQKPPTCPPTSKKASVRSTNDSRKSSGKKESRSPNTSRSSSPRKADHTTAPQPTSPGSLPTKSKKVPPQPKKTPKVTPARPMRPPWAEPNAQ